MSCCRWSADRVDAVPYNCCVWRVCSRGSWIEFRSSCNIRSIRSHRLWLDLQGRPNGTVRRQSTVCCHLTRMYPVMWSCVVLVVVVVLGQRAWHNNWLQSIWWASRRHIRATQAGQHSADSNAQSHSHCACCARRPSENAWMCEMRPPFVFARRWFAVARWPIPDRSDTICDCCSMPIYARVSRRIPCAWIPVWLGFWRRLSMETTGKWVYATNFAF